MVGVPVGDEEYLLDYVFLVVRALDSFCPPTNIIDVAETVDHQDMRIGSLEG